jgi:hypothetical protein
LNLLNFIPNQSIAWDVVVLSDGQKAEGGKQNNDRSEAIHFPFLLSIRFGAGEE